METGQNLSLDIRLLCWNVFHGRDAPPNKALFTDRSRWLRRTEDDGTYVQVNRRLFDEYAGVIAAADWSVCILQEFPPSWATDLARRCGAWTQRVKTSRNQFGPLTAAIARWNPDLVGANEGGSNTTLVRAPWRTVERKSLLLNPWPARGRDERRRMGFVRLQNGQHELCVTNLHATAHGQHKAEAELIRAAEHATRWAGDAPVVLAGDFNVRPRSSKLFDLLADRFGLTASTAPDAIDHLLVRGLEVVAPPQPWPDAARELNVSHGAASRRLRLSDHAPVEAVFSVPHTSMR